MENFEAIMYLIDQVLNTRRKRHVAGGIFLSASLLFGGLAITIITIKEKGDNNNEKKCCD